MNHCTLWFVGRQYVYWAVAAGINVHLRPHNHSFGTAFISQSFSLNVCFVLSLSAFLTAYHGLGSLQAGREVQNSISCQPRSTILATKYWNKGYMYTGRSCPHYVPLCSITSDQGMAKIAIWKCARRSKPISHDTWREHDQNFVLSLSGPAVLYEYLDCFQFWGQSRSRPSWFATPRLKKCSPVQLITNRRVATSFGFFVLINTQHRN